MPAHRIVDLFAGPGGLDVAARWLEVPATGVELDSNACATRDAAGLATKQGDVRDFGPSDFPDATVLAGGPPCQTYTVAGNGDGRRALRQIIAFARRMAKGKAEDVAAELSEVATDQRTVLVLEPLRWALAALEDGRPYEAIVLEQVQAVLPVWEVIGAVLYEKGYSVDYGILRAEQFGVPQTRRRAVLIARRSGPANLPGVTHRWYRKGTGREEGDRRLHPWVTMGDVLERPKPFEVISNYGTGGDPKARGRRTHDQPAFTVTGKISRNRVVAPGRPDSRFSHAEAGQLQSFPVDYQWCGSDIAQQIGNAVPPVLGIHVLVAALGLGFDSRDKALKKAASQRATIIPPENDSAAFVGEFSTAERGFATEGN
ncbi:DNA cytosine methyltransferase [Streptomyces carminius]|uniref:DNA (cytosine-5-)-methyltransferase n=1 Tax=Streptomyces carminius TaxID=2665496 RepID=A0A2M8M4P9_9ACTN|nr:DNA cytosine methyltransferase [Streptomyces carminius]PJE99176.1 DNA cytosine methyltransferase [Streptomyces carminius]